MAKSSLPVPKPFDFKKPDELARDKRCFEQYRQVYEIASKGILR